MKPEPLEAAKRFIDEKYPDCDAALLAGSVVRGQGTAASDLDIVLFDRSLGGSYRESFIFKEWPVELFAHTLTSYREFFESDRKRGRPSLPRMVVEGIVLKDSGVATQIKNEADILLQQGPEPWSSRTIDLNRYFLTDLLDDLSGSCSRHEDLFIAGELAIKLHEFVLRTNQWWTGNSKWVYRSLQEFDPDFAERFAGAFDRFYRTGDKTAVIQVAEHILAPVGGRLFEGFSIGKPADR